MTAEMEPIAMVDLLNDVFSHFDDLVEKHGVEKIRTIGDSYMVAAGVPTEMTDHASALAGLGLDMIDYLHELPSRDGHKLSFRIGINSGSVVGGVIGTHKFQYDLWGDAVNTAARMESHGVPGRIQITETTHQLIADAYLCESRGPIEIKGKGTMATWFVVGPK